VSHPVSEVVDLRQHRIILLDVAVISSLGSSLFPVIRTRILERSRFMNLKKGSKS
jgi:hypothetical protein